MMPCGLKKKTYFLFCILLKQRAITEQEMSLLPNRLTLGYRLTYYLSKTSHALQGRYANRKAAQIEVIKLNK